MAALKTKGVRYLILWRALAARGDWMQEDKGGIEMGDKGKKDKGRREQQKKAQLNPKEKRKLKREKKK
ncbi:hypothetical protein ACFL0Q_09650 [Thermodesulfobacteriota bacterium]